MSLILALSGVVAFACAAWALAFGLDDMALRYPLAALAGYITFLLLIRVWIALHRMGRRVDLDLPDFPGGSSGGEDALHGFGGGQSGGAGASADWGSPTDALGAGDLDVDFDAALPIVLAVAFLFASVAAMFYVLSVAPVLLAEVALDAALVAGIYRKLRKEDARHWLGSAVRQTWPAALIVALSVSFAGAVLQWAKPEARSIGDVVRAVAQ
jgi:hypothetical protein